MSTRLKLHRGNGGRGGGGSRKGEDGESRGDRLGPIPFPGLKDGAAGRDAGADSSAKSSRRHAAMVRDMERALDRAQSQVESLRELVDEPLRFPGSCRGEDDGGGGWDGPRPAA